MDPPIDNADPVAEENEGLKIALRSLARSDWGVEFKELGHPTQGFTQSIAVSALQRIQELEFAAEVRLPKAIEYLDTIKGGCPLHRPEDGCDCLEELARMAIEGLT